MPETQHGNRRSTRVFTRVRVGTTGKNAEGRQFREASESIVVSAHGALLYIRESLELGALIVLVNPLTQEEQECRVVYLGDYADKGQRVGVEFLSPAPHFWGMEFSPADWPAPSQPAPPN